MPLEIKALIFGLAVALTIAIVSLVFGQRPELWEAVQRRLFGVGDELMSTDKLVGDAAVASEPSHEPLRQSGSAAFSTTLSVSAPDDELGPISADADALPPRISLHLTKDEIIALLALQRPKPGAPYTFSQNQIVKLVGGTAADVHAKIKAVREDAPAVYAALDEQGQQVPGQFVVARK